MFSVVANPYCAPLDHKGRPCGAVMVEQPPGIAIREFVGARIKSEYLEGPIQKGDLRSRRQDTVFLFTAEPVKVPATPYYRRLVNTGQLFAADAPTARKCGIKAAEFKQPAELLKLARDAREAEYKANLGDRAEDAPPQPVAEMSDAPPAATTAPSNQEQGNKSKKGDK